MSYIKNTNITSLALILLNLTIFCPAIFGQIEFDNGSFEDTPADATMPSGWWLVARGTTPDILPGYWGVYDDPADGETFIGMITRQDGTIESIGQRLSKTLEKEGCYSTSIDLAHSSGYVGYNTPIKLRIYLGSSRKSKDQLIYESEKVENSEWEKHLIEFIPKQNYRYFIIEAYTDDGPTIRGNILIDNLTPIINCNRA